MTVVTRSRSSGATAASRARADRARWADLPASGAPLAGSTAGGEDGVVEPRTAARRGVRLLLHGVGQLVDPRSERLERPA
ncbi:hypothetical protein KQ708_15765, partial [Listeria monocytogenes]|nr:hypothetical protein [Listeria monocytogenes]